MGFDFETGLPKEITIFVNSPNICWQKPTEMSLPETIGYPSADLSFARKHHYYYDEISLKFSLIPAETQSSATAANTVLRHLKLTKK